MSPNLYSFSETSWYGLNRLEFGSRAPMSEWSWYCLRKSSSACRTTFGKPSTHAEKPFVAVADDKNSIGENCSCSVAFRIQRSSDLGYSCRHMASCSIQEANRWHLGARGMCFGSSNQVAKRCVGSLTKKSKSIKVNIRTVALGSTCLRLWTSQSW